MGKASKFPENPPRYGKAGCRKAASGTHTWLLVTDLDSITAYLGSEAGPHRERGGDKQLVGTKPPGGNKRRRMR
jgi:hypothetical protein